MSKNVLLPACVLCLAAGSLQAQSEDRQIVDDGPQNPANLRQGGGPARRGPEVRSQRDGGLKEPRRNAWPRSSTPAAWRSLR